MKTQKILSTLALATGLLIAGSSFGQETQPANNKFKVKETAIKADQSNAQKTTAVQQTNTAIKGTDQAATDQVTNTRLRSRDQTIREKSARFKRTSNK